jgi:NADH:quinone reductase (non-electrogenic)
MKGKLAAAAATGGTAIVAYELYSRYRRPKPLKGSYPEAPKKVLVVGGGLGGLAVVEGLAKALDGSQEEVGVALLDRVNYTTFWPMVPAAISADVEVRHAAHSIRRITRPLGVEFLEAEVRGVDFEAREVHSNVGTFSYDYLILAPGSRTAFFGAPGAQEHAIDLKGLRDALRVRHAVIDRLEEAERSKGEFGDGLLTFVFVGGGPTGVEGVAESHDLIFDVLKEDYPNVDFGRVRLVLVNSEDRILEGLDPSLANAASRRLASRKVEIINDVKAEEVGPEAVVLSDGRTIPTRTTVWAAGIEPPPLVQDLDVPKDRRGHILVDEFLRVEGSPGVYAVGDCIGLEAEGEQVPALAQAAEQEGGVAALNLAADLRGKNPTTPFRYRPLGQLVDLGSGGALVDVLGVKFGGILGALVWKGVYLYELGNNLNRARVLFDWVVDLFARPDTSKVFEIEARAK